MNAAGRCRPFGRETGSWRHVLVSGSYWNLEWGYTVEDVIFTINTLSLLPCRRSLYYFRWFRQCSERCFHMVCFCLPKQGRREIWAQLAMSWFASWKTRPQRVCWDGGCGMIDLKTKSTKRIQECILSSLGQSTRHYDLSISWIVGNKTTHGIVPLL